MKINNKQRLAKRWFAKLQNIICKSIESLEKDYGSNKKFKKNKWKHGEFRIIKGEVIEKGGVAFSNVKGKFSKKFAKRIPGTKNDTRFWSSGISVVLHPKNPKIPAMHFNTRYICTEKNWFGGGMDATPCLKDEREKNMSFKERGVSVEKATPGSFSDLYDYIKANKEKFDITDFSDDI